MHMHAWSLTYAHTMPRNTNTHARHTCVHIPAQAYVHMHSCQLTHKRTHLHTGTWTCRNTQINSHMQVLMEVYMQCTLTFVHTDVYTCAHARLHTRTTAHTCKHILRPVHIHSPCTHMHKHAHEQLWKCSPSFLPLSITPHLHLSIHPSIPFSHCPSITPSSPPFFSACFSLFPGANEIYLHPNHIHTWSPPVFVSLAALPAFPLGAELQ